MKSKTQTHQPPKGAQWARRRIMHDKDHPLNQEPEQEILYGSEVGLILGVMNHGAGYLPSKTKWARSVPKEYRKPGPVRRVK